MRRAAAKPKLIIVGDDFGVNRFRTDGLVEAFISRPAAISNVAMLVNGHDTDRAAKLAKQWSIPTGLHFNVTEGRPISDPAKIPSLTNDGLFLGKEKAFRLLHSASPAVLEEVAVECRAQIERCGKLLERSVKHFDGHHHIHVLPSVWQSLEPVLLSCGIQSVRIPADAVYQGSSTMEGPPELDSSNLHGEPFWQLVTMWSKCILQTSPAIRSQQLYTTPAFIGIDLSFNVSKERLQSRLQSAVSSCRNSGREPVIEVMAHIGHPARSDVAAVEEAYKWCYDAFSASEDREMERILYCGSAEELRRSYDVITFEAAARQATLRKQLKSRL